MMDRYVHAHWKNLRAQLHLLCHPYHPTPAPHHFMYIARLDIITCSRFRSFRRFDLKNYLARLPTPWWNDEEHASTASESLAVCCDDDVVTTRSPAYKLRSKRVLRTRHTPQCHTGLLHNSNLARYPLCFRVFYFCYATSYNSFRSCSNNIRVSYSSYYSLTITIRVPYDYYTTKHAT